MQEVEEKRKQFLPSNVRSSCVGPMPPDVRTNVYALENWATSFAMVGTSSGITET